MWMTLAAMGIMGTASAISGHSARKKARKQLREDRDRQLELMDLDFEHKKDEANKNADASDRRSDFNEDFTADAANSQFDMLAAGQEEEALAFNMEAMQAGSQRGSGLAQLAASGTRDSSVATAIDLESAVNEAQLQAKEDYSRASTDYNINNILRSFNNDVFTLQENRTNAMDLRNSFKDGGYNQRTYALNREGLQKQYNRQIDDLKDSWSNTFNEFFGGAQQGYALGSGIENFMVDYKTTVDKGNGVFSFNNLSNNNGQFKLNDFSKVKLNANDWYGGLYS